MAALEFKGFGVWGKPFERLNPECFSLWKLNTVKEVFRTLMPEMVGFRIQGVKFHPMIWCEQCGVSHAHIQLYTWIVYLSISVFLFAI